MLEIEGICEYSWGFQVSANKCKVANFEREFGGCTVGRIP